MINNSDIALSSTVSVHNGLETKVVGVMFVYLGCEGRRSSGFELYLPIDSMNVVGNDQEFKASLL